MSDGRKLILTPFTGRKKNEKYNIIKEKYIPVKRRQNSIETDSGSYYNKESYGRILLVEFSDGKGAFYNGNESDNSDNDDEN